MWQSFFIKISVWTIALVVLFPAYSFAEDTQEDIPGNVVAAAEKKKQLTSETLNTLLTYVEIQDQLRKEIKSLGKQLKTAQSESEKKDIRVQLEKAQQKLQGTTINLENIAADTDLNLLRVNKEEPFNLQKELFSLLEPALKEMKHATSDVRLKSQLREKITYFKQREPIDKKR